MLETLGLKGWAIGKTKVFLKYYHVDQLRDQINVFNARANNLQKLARGFMGRKAHARRLVQLRVEVCCLVALLCSRGCSTRRPRHS